MEHRGQQPLVGANTPPARVQQPGTTGKRLSDERLQILERLLQLQKLTNHDIAFALECDERTVRRRRYQYLELGKLIHKHPEVAKNAEKLKPKHLEKLQEWLRDNESVLLEDMQEFLKRECGLEVSVSTISRQLKRASGNASKRQHGAKARLKLKRERDAEGRELNYTLDRTAVDGHRRQATSEQSQGAAIETLRVPVLPVAPVVPPLSVPLSVPVPIPVVPMMPVAPIVPMGQIHQIPEVVVTEAVFRPMDLGV